MRRLIIDETLSPESPEGCLRDLVRAMPPLEPTPFAADRILARVNSAAMRRRRPPWVVPAIALGIGISAVAAASVGRFHVERPLSSPEGPAPLSPAFEASVAPVSVEVGSVASAAASEPLLDPSIRHARSQATPSTRIASRSTGVGPPLPSGEDPALLLEAIRTLRTSGDPARAGVLLAQYLKAYPRSPLLEDALALSIEAAAARHDIRTAAELARRYLAKFPTGRYRAFVLRAGQPNPQL